MEGPTVHRTRLRMSREGVIVEEMKKHFLLGHIFMESNPEKIKTANSQAACFCPGGATLGSYPTEFCHASCGFPEKEKASLLP